LVASSWSIRSEGQQYSSSITRSGHAEPDRKLEIYRSLGLRLSYDPETQTVRASF